MKVHEITSNQYYGGLNNRFDNRCVLLHRAGFIFDKERTGFYNPLETYQTDYQRARNFIPNMKVMHSDKRAFVDNISQLCRNTNFFMR